MKRKRSLRAAYAVTLGVALAACGQTHETSDAMADAMTDAGTDVMTSDASCVGRFPETEECCESWGGEWIGGDDGTGSCAVPGPFVPPAMIG